MTGLTIDFDSAREPSNSDVIKRLDAIDRRLEAIERVQMGIERMLMQLPNLLHLTRDPIAQKVVEALRKDATVQSFNKPTPIDPNELMKVPDR
jgi:hypothetical protein